MDFFTTAWSWFKGSSFSSSLAKVALVGYASRLLSDNTNESSQGQPEAVDPGVRLQLNPSTETKIPVLYGEAYFGGNITDAVLSTDYKKMTYCLTLTELTGTRLSNSAGTIYSWQDVYLNNNRVVFKADGYTVDYTLDASGNQDISFRDLIKIYVYFESTGVQPQGYSGTTPSPYTTMPGWTSGTHTMPDLMYAVVEVTYNRANNVTALPECLFHVTSDMTKPGDVLVDYMTDTDYGAGIAVADIDLDSFTALNTFADTGFTYTNTLGQTVTGVIDINGLIDTSTDVLRNMEEIAKCSSAWLSFDIHSGKWIAVINKAETSIASITDSNMVGEISISGTSLTQLNNVADVKYPNTDILDKNDFVKITIPSGDLYTNEPRSSLQLTLPYTNKQSTALRIGTQLLKQGRVDKIISLTLDYSLINLRAGDVIDVTSTPYGFVNKKFRVITAQESQGDSGEITVAITALEYDANVYTYSITEFEIETDDGILGIGSIGKPNTPTVTKTEQSNVPKIVVNAVVPSGIVDTIEFWLTFDTTVPSDANRTYIQIGSYSNTGGTQLTENQAVSYTYSGLAQSNFYVKVRGVNSVATGPFSDPSGLIAYVPVVTADTLSDNPVSVNGTLMSLGLLTLLNNLDLLYKGITDPGSLFDEIFKRFEEKTGTDLVSQATGGLAATLSVQDEGIPITSTVGTINFVGDGVVATAAGNTVTVTIAGTSGGGGGGTGTSGGCLLTQGLLYPPDKGTNIESYPEGTPDKAPITGNYYAQYSGGIYAQLTAGSGNVKLYKSNGTLVQTLTAAQCMFDKNTVVLPFSTRTKGTDYYILMDAGIGVSQSGCLTPAISDPKTWNFNTPWEDISPYSPTTELETAPGGCGNLQYTAFDVRSYFSGSDIKLKASRHTDIIVKYSVPITIGTTGSVKIYKADGTLHQAINASDTFVSNKVSELLWTVSNDAYNALVIDPTVDLTPGATYYVTIDAGVVKDACGLAHSGISNPNTIRFTVDGGPVATLAALPSSGSVNEAPVAMTFDRPVVASTGSLKVYDSSNNLITTVASTSPAVTYTQGV